MSKICAGKTGKKQKCARKAIKGTPFCGYHKNQTLVAPIEVLNQPLLKETSISLSDSEEECTILNITHGPCSICLLEVEGDAFPLECIHKHHVWCIKSWMESASKHSHTCPVCRIPITTPIEIDDQKKIENKITAMESSIQEDILLARELAIEDELVREPDNYDIQNEPVMRQNDLQDADLNLAIEASLSMVEENEYNMTAKILEDSYYFAEEEDNLMVEMVLKMSVETEKQERENETIDKTIKRLLKNQPSIIMTLKAPV